MEVQIDNDNNRYGPIISSIFLLPLIVSLPQVPTPSQRVTFDGIGLWRAAALYFYPADLKGWTVFMTDTDIGRLYNFCRHIDWEWPWNYRTII
jgi:hypothetical protein